MPGEFAEHGQVLEMGFEVADVGLVFGERYAVAAGGWDNRRDAVYERCNIVIFAESAGRSRAGAGVRGVPGGKAFIKVVIISWVKLVLSNVGGLVLEEQTPHPVKCTAGF